MDKPYYIVGKDIEKNQIIVSNKTSDNTTSSESSSYVLGKINWITVIPEKNKEYTAQIRYHGEYFPCTVIPTDTQSATVKFKTKILVSKGQSIVMYDNDTCLGGGVVM